MRPLLNLVVAGALAAPLVLPAAARAQDAQAIKISIEQLRSPDADPNNDDSWQVIDDVDFDRFFNEYACLCASPVRIRFERDQLASFDGNVEIWFGSRCNEIDQTRDQRCAQPTAADKNFPADVLDTEDKYVITTANEIMFPPSFQCGVLEGQANIWALIDADANQEYESSSVSANYTVDTDPPPLPLPAEVNDAEDSVVVTWTTPSADVDDIYGYQFLCEREDGTPVFAEPRSLPEWQYDASCAPAAPQMPDGGLPDAGVPVADAGADAAPGPDAAPVPDAGPTPDAEVVTGARSLDERYICSGFVSRQSEEYQIELPSDLEKDETIHVYMVVIDPALNPELLDVGTAKAIKVQDFWETYGAEGGGAEGGFCFVATAAYGDYDHPFVVVLRDFRDGTLARFGLGRSFIRWYYAHSPGVADYIREHTWARVVAQVILWPVVVLAGGWQYTGPLDKLLLVLAFVAWRRRRRLAGALAGLSLPRPAVAAAAAIVLTFAGVRAASAQSIYDEDLDAETFDEGPPKSYWTFELKFGPYTPDIDGEIATDPGPYERMFCDDEDPMHVGEGGCNPWSLMTLIELDRYFVHPLGQLGLGFGWGYMSNSARAFAEGADGRPNYGMRAEADETSFKLMPLSVSAVYRFTKLADDTYVPLVPYAKVGVSYYIWWITKGDGEVTSTPGNGDAYGGTLGWQGTVGLFVRADRIDPQASRNLQTETGVEHAGFFFEMTYADVSGLGMERKLHVGDLFWTAGIGFDF
jgi:hypothetical protein